jgi:hypothetical protein
MFVEIPPPIAVSDFVRRFKGRHCIGCRWSSRTCASAPGGDISGLAAASPPPTVTSQAIKYFSISKSTKLPASPGSYSFQLSLRFKTIFAAAKQEVADVHDLLRKHYK